MQHGILCAKAQAVFVIRRHDRSLGDNRRGLKIFTRYPERTSEIAQLLRRQGHDQPFRRLLKFQATAIAQQLNPPDLVLGMVSRSAQGADNQFIFHGPAQSRGVEGFTIGRKADVPGAVFEIFLEGTALGLNFAFAINQPGTRAENGFPINRIPLRQLLQHGFHFGIQRAIGPQYHVKQQIAVLAGDVHEHVNRPA